MGQASNSIHFPKTFFFFSSFTLSLSHIYSRGRQFSSDVSHAQYDEKRKKNNIFLMLRASTMSPMYCDFSSLSLTHFPSLIIKMNRFLQIFLSLLQIFFQFFFFKIYIKNQARKFFPSLFFSSSSSYSRYQFFLK